MSYFSSNFNLAALEIVFTFCIIVFLWMLFWVRGHKRSFSAWIVPFCFNLTSERIKAKVQGLSAIHMNTYSLPFIHHFWLQNLFLVLKNCFLRNRFPKNKQPLNTLAMFSIPHRKWTCAISVSHCFYNALFNLFFSSRWGIRIFSWQYIFFCFANEGKQCKLEKKSRRTLSSRKMNPINNQIRRT